MLDHHILSKINKIKYASIPVQVICRYLEMVVVHYVAQVSILIVALEPVLRLALLANILIKQLKHV